MSSRKANCKWTVSFSATSQIHFIGNLVFISRDRFFTVCQASALDEVCSVALLTGSAGWPDCCLVSEACSHMSAVQLTHPLFCTSSIWQDPFCLLFFDCYSFLLLLWARFFFLFLFCVYSLATHHPTVPMTVDRWLVDAGKRTCSWFTQNAVLSLNKMWNEDTNAKKEKKKEFWQWVLWDLFFFLNITPWVRIASLFRLSSERDSPRLPGSNERSDSWQSFLQPVWQTLFCSTGPFHWVSAKAVGIMDTSLYEAWCMNNGLFVCFPVHVVHVFYNQARTITLCVFMCVRVFVQHVFVKCDALLFDALS